MRFLSLYLYRIDRLKIEVCTVPLRCKVIERSLHEHVCVYDQLCSLVALQGLEVALEGSDSSEAECTDSSFHYST